MKNIQIVITINILVPFIWDRKVFQDFNLVSNQNWLGFPRNCTLYKCTPKCTHTATLLQFANLVILIYLRYYNKRVTKTKKSKRTSTSFCFHSICSFLYEPYVLPSVSTVCVYRLSTVSVCVYHRCLLFVYCVRMFVPSVSTVCLLCPYVCTVCVYCVKKKELFWARCKLLPIFVAKTLNKIRTFDSFWQ